MVPIGVDKGQGTVLPGVDAWGGYAVLAHAGPCRFKLLAGICLPAEVATLLSFG